MCIFFFLIFTKSYQSIRFVELVDGVCWGCVSSSFLSPLNHIRVSSLEHHLILLRREDLKCTFCGSGITTEMLHYIFDCAALSEERRKLNDKTGQLCPSFPALINEISKNRRWFTVEFRQPDPGSQTTMGPLYEYIHNRKEAYIELLYSRQHRTQQPPGPTYVQWRHECIIFGNTVYSAYNKVGYSEIPHIANEIVCTKEKKGLNH
ncbi:hypothetical protein LAZ67_7000275 [Cordylochernes scorpioides]|uniref:Tick transposon n=1 Tax=Cordylochernes scorpioides TaxID=51811 RepID=A0ABY6KLF2_9ARAC|nr:hypothetical protein LAZ67_7000275 [Cordylochernes scorpioides]